MTGLLLLSGALALRAAGPGELPLVLDGEPAGAVETYEKGDRLYLELRSLVRAYGGRHAWQAVSGRVTWRREGRTLELDLDGTGARLSGSPFELPHPPMVRASRAYLPVEFVLGPEFAGFAGRRSVLEDGVLKASRKLTIGGLRVFSYNDRTRLELELDPSVSPQPRRRDGRTYEVLLPEGVAEAELQREVRDGVVRAVRLDLTARVPRLAIELDRADPVWALGRRGNHLLVDVLRPAPPAAPAPEPAQPELKPAHLEPATLTPPPALAPGKKRPLIVIDPGHGGKDPGSIGQKGSYEKDVTLAMAKELAELLNEEGRFRVVLTRDRDVFIPLAGRSDLANEKEADLFISLHCNSHKDSKLHGFEVYYLSEGASDPWAASVAAAENAVVKLEERKAELQAAAKILHDMARNEFINEGSALSGLMSKEIASRVDMRNRGTKEGDFFVLRGTLAPSVLVESGFLTNPRDHERLTSGRHRRRIVEGIYAGILRYAALKKWEY